MPEEEEIESVTSVKKRFQIEIYAILITLFMCFIVRTNIPLQNLDKTDFSKHEIMEIYHSDYLMTSGEVGFFLSGLEED